MQQPQTHIPKIKRLAACINFFVSFTAAHCSTTDDDDDDYEFQCQLLFYFGLTVIYGRSHSKWCAKWLRLLRFGKVAVSWSFNFWYELPNILKRTQTDRQTKEEERDTYIKKLYAANIPFLHLALHFYSDRIYSANDDNLHKRSSSSSNEKKTSNLI